MLTTQDLKSGCNQYYGTEKYWYHPLNKNIKYTDGAQYFFENAECYWLLDIILTEIVVAAKKWTKEEGDDFFLIKLTVSDKNTAVLSVNSNNHKGKDTVIWTRTIEFTDAPKGEWKLYFANDVILLPTEY